MADDAGALLVRSGLVPSNALEDARARVASAGGTLGEQLVAGGAITDEALTSFFRTRLLVPQVNPNVLARLTPKIVATIPSELAIELRAIPVSLDGDNNLTVAMSDPSDRHAVDELAFFTGAYVVRAVATQMQIAWCLAHYYGHVTTLGQRLLQADAESPLKAALSAGAQRVPRTKGLTGKVNATRHRAIAPITGPINPVRPSSDELDIRGLGTAGAPPEPRPITPAPRPITPVPGPIAPAPRPITPVPGPIAPAPRPMTPVPGPIMPAPRPITPVPGPITSAPRPITPVPGPITPAPRPITPVPGPITPAPGPVTAVGRPVTPAPRPVTPVPGPITPAPRPVTPVPGPITAVGRPVTPAPRSVTPVPTAGARSAASTPPGIAPRPTPVSVPPPAVSAARPGPTGGPVRPPIIAGTVPAATPPRPTAVSAPPPMVAAAPPRTLPTSTPSPDGTANWPPSGIGPDASGPVPRAAPDATTLPPLGDDPDGGATAFDDLPETPRARSVSGEIRVPIRRAASIRPPLPSGAEEDDEPLIMIQHGALDDEATGSRRLTRRRVVRSDPPELYARAGEVDLKTEPDHAVDADEPRIVVDEDALAPPGPSGAPEALADDAMPALPMIDVMDDADTGAVIRDRVFERASSPILLVQPRTMSDQIRAAAAATLATLREEGHLGDDEDTGETDVVVLVPKPKLPRLVRVPRRERNTQHGVPPAPSAARPHHHDTSPTGVPAMIERRDVDQTHRTGVGDATSIDLPAAPPGDETASDQIAAPPAPHSDEDTNPHIVAPPPAPRTVTPPRAVLVDDDHDTRPPGPRTVEMSRAELDDAIPGRAPESLPGHLARHRIDHDPVDDGWGPPGTTIPPPLLGAVPEGDDDDDDEASNVIPMPSIDSSPLIVGPPSLPSSGESGGRALVRALEDATARAIDVIHRLERTQTRDDVVNVMVAHLAETHHRAGFFVTRPGASKGTTELSVFAMTPRPPAMPPDTLRLDRPSTLQDVVGTRLPYRGPMHDDASRSFLVAVLGACPAEILLVPVAVRERVVGVLFGEHRQRHTFDDQLALAARAAGMALERILKAKRG